MGCFTDPHFLRGTEIPKKPEATGSAGSCDPGVGGSPTHTLSPACFSHPLCRPEPGLFPEERNPMLFRRKRRVPRTRGFLRERAVGSVPHTGPTRAFLGLGRVLSPPWVETRHNGPYTPEKPGAFPSGEDGCCAPEGFSLTKPQAWSCTQGRNRRDWVSFRW